LSRYLGNIWNFTPKTKWRHPS